MDTGTQPLDADQADARNNLGIEYFTQGLLAEAVDCFRQVLRGNPHHAGALNNLGFVLYSQGKVEEAIACYRQTLLIYPNHADAHNNLGVALESQGELTQALACYRQALVINPNHADALNNFADANYKWGHALMQDGAFAEATTYYRQALLVKPNHVEAINNLGIVLKDLGQPAEAIAFYRQALSLNPTFADAHNNLGNAWFVQGRIDEAAASYEQALTLDAGHKQAHYNRAILRLLHGDFEGGWPGYEQRWEQPNSVSRSFPQPLWNGAPLEDKTILIHAEQGLGDTIQFIRYAPLVKKRGGRVMVECQPALLRLLEGVAGVDQLVPSGQPLPAFDVHTRLLSLPALFGTTLATIPAVVPYLTADPRLVEFWGKELIDSAVAFNSPLNVGIVWKGSPGHRADCYRSVSLEYFAALGRLEGIQLVSLQVGSGCEQLASAPSQILDLGSRFDPNSLEDLAAAIMNMDLIVTVDTAVAHLAGALGKLAWVLLPIAPDWRWLLDRQDSPWYPTLRLFRQRQPGDWQEVFERVGVEVMGLIEKMKNEE